MEYTGVIAELLARAGAAPGDEIEVRTADGRSVAGRVMEHHGASAPEILTLKLASGYNVGLALDARAEIHLVRKAAARPAPKALPQAKGKPRVAILATGGTIASYVDYRTGAVHPASTPEELAAAVPELFDIADLSTHIVFRMFSEDLQPEHWQKLAHEVKREFDAGARGVVITHGTDTMSYTSAALSFFLRDLPGPVVLVGAQRSSDRPSSDAATNLRAAVLIAASTDLGEVVAAMHAGSADTSVAIHRGTRVRKMHTSARDAFRSVNARPIGFVEFPAGNEPFTRLTEPYRPKSPGPCIVDDKLDEEVAVIQSYPGLWPSHLSQVVLRGVVLVGTGLGHVARKNLDAIREMCAGEGVRGDGRPRNGEPAYVVMTSQCLAGRVNMNVYSTGRDLLAAGVISAEDMLPETAYIKLMWVLGHTDDPAEVRRMMATDLVGEMDPRTALETLSQVAP